MKALSPKPSLTDTEMTEVITRTKATIHASPLVKTRKWKDSIMETPHSVSNFLCGDQTDGLFIGLILLFVLRLPYS